MEDFRTKFQNVALTANNVSIFFANLKAFRFFKSTGISSQRTDAEKATVCFPMLEEHCLKVFNYNMTSINGHQPPLVNGGFFVLADSPYIHTLLF